LYTGYLLAAESNLTSPVQLSFLTRIEVHSHTPLLGGELVEKLVMCFIVPLSCCSGGEPHDYLAPIDGKITVLSKGSWRTGTSWSLTIPWRSPHRQDKLRNYPKHKSASSNR
jgi:hypothetical protein